MTSRYPKNNGRKCIVGNCASAKMEDVSFFILPQSSALRNQWIQFAKCKPAADRYLTYMCHLHFEDYYIKNNVQYQSGLTRRRYLSSDAIPTLQPTNDKAETGDPTDQCLFASLNEHQTPTSYLGHPAYTGSATYATQPAASTETYLSRRDYNTTVGSYVSQPARTNTATFIDQSTSTVTYASQQTSTGTDVSQPVGSTTATDVSQPTGTASKGLNAKVKTTNYGRKKKSGNKIIFNYCRSTENQDEKNNISMNRKCMVFNCTGPTQKGVSLFLLPKDSAIRLQWIKFAELDYASKDQPCKTMCHLHFEEHTFKYNYTIQHKFGWCEYRCLKPDAVPTLHPCCVEKTTEQVTEPTVVQITCEPQIPPYFSAPVPLTTDSVPKSPNNQSTNPTNSPEDEILSLCPSLSTSENFLNTVSPEVEPPNAPLPSEMVSAQMKQELIGENNSENPVDINSYMKTSSRVSEQSSVNYLNVKEESAVENNTDKSDDTMSSGGLYSGAPLLIQDTSENVKDETNNQDNTMGTSVPTNRTESYPAPTTFDSSMTKCAGCSSTSALENNISYLLNYNPEFQMLNESRGLPVSDEINPMRKKLRTLAPKGIPKLPIPKLPIPRLPPK